MNLKNYLVFIGLVYYPSGGWEDFRTSFDTREKAKEFIEKEINLEDYNWGQVAYIGNNSDELLIERYDIYHINNETKGEWSEPIT